MNGTPVIHNIDEQLVEQEYRHAMRDGLLVCAAKMGRTLDINTRAALLLDGKVLYDPRNGHLLVKAARRGELNAPPARDQVELLAGVILSSRAAVLSAEDAMKLASDLVRGGWRRE